MKAFTCFAFALALVLSPPSAAHAGSGMHDGHLAKSVGVAEAHESGSDAHHAQPSHKIVSDIVIAVPGEDGEKQQSDECCNGICISAVFLEDTMVSAEPVGSREYVILDGQTHSVETSGLLRPPRFLI